MVGNFVQSRVSDSHEMTNFHDSAAVPIRLLSSSAILVLFPIGICRQSARQIILVAEANDGNEETTRSKLASQTPNLAPNSKLQRFGDEREYLEYQLKQLSSIYYYYQELRLPESRRLLVNDQSTVEEDRYRSSY